MSSPEEVQALPAGTRFGTYRLERLIGTGGMASVYEATHVGLKKRVALKLLHAAYANNDEVKARFLREGEAAARILHPNVVDVTDLGVKDGVPYLVMELLVGESLAQKIERERLMPVDRAVDVLLPIISAVGYAHDEGVVHRDLKPDNVFLSRNRLGLVEAKLLDFGISKLASRSERTTAQEVLGTPHYLSPEQAQAARDLDGRSDQYSIGVMLFRLVTGALPVVGENPAEVMLAVAQGRIRLPRAVKPELPEALERVLLRALATQPKDRYPHVHLLGSELLPFASNDGRAAWHAHFELRREELGAPPLAPITQPMSVPAAARRPSTAPPRPSSVPERPASVPPLAPGPVSAPIAVPPLQPGPVSGPVPVAAALSGRIPAGPSSAALPVPSAVPALAAGPISGSIAVPLPSDRPAGAMPLAGHGSGAMYAMPAPSHVSGSIAAMPMAGHGSGGMPAMARQSASSGGVAALAPGSVPGLAPLAPGPISAPIDVSALAPVSRSGLAFAVPGASSHPGLSAAPLSSPGVATSSPGVAPAPVPTSPPAPARSRELPEPPPKPSPAKPHRPLDDADDLTVRMSANDGPTPSLHGPARSPATLAVIALLAVGAVAGGIWWTGRPKPQPQATPVARYRIAVQVEPDGAEIAIDGEPRGRGKIDLELPADGREHRLSARATGFVPVELTFREGKVPPDRIKLEREPVE